MAPTDLPTNLNTSPPTVPESAFIAAGAQVMGDVRLGEQCSIWYNAVVRGDINYIEIGARSNIQDGCILHVTNAQPCSIGSDVTAGHGANLHACTVEDGCLIGIGAIVLSGAHIGRGTIVGAGAVVREGETIEPFSLVVGVPARLVRALPTSTYDTHCRWAQKYVGLAQAHRLSSP
ncbi:MAG: gamma carbonic anhydrase family protein [Candidatus Latescibacterota bacterium]|jgi:carbonic anhydrase/acetyltransferase-like protein (isoleucine patch superfamily)